MPRITPTDWQTQVKIFKADGFTLAREKGSHLAFTKPGIPRPIIIPKYSEIGVAIIKGNMRTASMSRNRYFELLGSL